MGSQWQGGSQSNAHLGATFYPGHDDDYNMPVISPRPQRNMPEMPDQIAQNLAHLELEARSPSSLSGLQSPPPMNMQNPHQYTQRQPSSSTTYSHESAAPVQRGHSPHPNLVDEPSFSPFPVIRDRKLHIPPTDEEKEDILEKARLAVLSSNDPEMQLAWAQDTLAFVEIAIQNERRLSKTRPPRSKTPTVEHNLREDAVNIVTFLAQQHHPKAEFLRGTWLEFGRFGHAMDKREAYRCYNRSAQNGYVRAEYRMGMQFENSNEYDKAIQHYSIGIQQGDAASNYRMGMMKLLGQCGQRQDFGQGLDMLRYSADNADENAPQGAYVFGMLNARELPEVSVPENYLPLDIEVARLNIEKAAYLGFAKAQVKMGSAYELCELGCQFDPAVSLHYSNLAARQGEPEAEMAISKWFLSGCEGLFAKDEGMAFAYAQRAAADGLPTAEFAMGYFYEVGIHVPTSIKEAQQWYGKAADHGNKDALGRIDGISRSKTLSRKDHEKIALSKIKSVRRRGESTDQGGQPSAPTIDMPAFPSAQDQYTQGYNTGYPPSQPSDGYNQRPGAGYNQGYNQGYGQGPSQGSQYPPAGQGPGNGFQGYTQRPQPSPAPGSYPASPAFDPRPPQGGPHGAPYGAQSPYNQQYPQQGGPPPHNGNYGRPGPSPAPSMQSASYGPGPAGYGPANNLPPPGFRTNTGPGPAPSPHPPGAPQNGRKPLGSPAGAMPSPTPSQPSPGLTGLGFVAPQDISGADRRRIPRHTDHPNQPPPSKGGYGGPTGPAPGRPQAGQYPSNSTNPRPPRGDSMRQRPPGAPAGGHSDAPSSAPSSARPTPQQQNNPTSKPAAKPSGPAQQAPTAKPPGPTQQAPPARRPGKGPATFEEMGVPASKKQEDCIVM